MSIRLFGFILLFISSCCSINSALAVDAPRSLEEWKPWIMEKHPTENCPIAHNANSRTCVWFSSLAINANPFGANFSQKVEVYKKEWVALPGSVAYWPQNVSENFMRVPVRDNNNQPEIFLTPGVHQITGEIRWSEMPRTLPVPNHTGIIQLTLNGKIVATPGLEDSNKLWLSANQKQNANTHQDSFELRVFRKISDQIPLQITTQLQMNVSGKERELQLGKLLLAGFTPTEFTSELPARIEKDGNLRIQVKPGSWELTLVSHSLTPLKEFNFTRTNDYWPDQEVWSFEAQHEMRSTQISGADTIDPAQTQMPEDWKNLPAYLMSPESHLKIEELERGENKELGNQLTLNRSAWLSFDGSHFTVQDTISGTTHHTRLETIAPLELTSAKIAEEPQVVTQLGKEKNTGFEIRERQVNVTGVSQLPKKFVEPVSGWNEKFESVRTQLYFPPGYSILGATGTSNEYGTWISKWNLWDIFVVLVIAVAVARLTTLTYGLLAAATLTLICQRVGAPVFIWLNILAAVALTTVVSGKFKVFIARYTYLSFFALALAILPFVIHQARLVINPNLENEYFDSFIHIGTSAKKSRSITYLHEMNEQPMAMDIQAAPEPAEAAPPTYKDEPPPPPNTSDSISAEDVGSFPDKSLSEPLQRIPGVKIDRKKSYPQSVLNRIDSSIQTQTGIAVPHFNENQITLEWTGAVKTDETTKLYLVPPFINRIGYLLSAFLPLLLAGVLLKQFLTSLNKKFELPKFSAAKNATTAAALIISVFTLIQPNHVQAQVDPSLIREYEARLTEAPKCLPNCASIESVALKATQDQLQLDLVVHSQEFIAFPLPADHEQWWPYQVLVDGREATLVQSAESKILVNLNKGRHNIILRSNIQGSDTLNLEFATPLHNVATQTKGWEVSGVPTPEQQSQSLQLQRVEQTANSAKSERLRPDPISPFVIVRREISLDLEWTLHTTVTRIAPTFGAINLEVPLLAGEAPLTTQVNGNEKIAVHLEANQAEFDWTSKLNPVTPLKLEAAKNVPWIEVWILNSSTRWHTEASGIPAVHFADAGDSPVWAPWPGESVSLSIVKPQATKGKLMTIDSAALYNNLGNRSSETQLALQLRTNQGGQYSFQLPEQSDLSSLKIDGNEQHVSVIKGLLKIPLHPGAQNIEIRWKNDDSIGIISRSPIFKLDGGSSNQSIHITLPDNRWPLFVFGPAVGPSILLWGVLLVVIVISIVLGRSGLQPLKTYEWILLSLGVCTQNLFSLVLVAVWFRALQSRGTLASVPSEWRFRLMQIALFIFSAITLVTLISTVPQGLLSSPDMRILGNNSYFNQFNWYQDFSAAEFPQATVISLPLWCYKLVILLWALWLASAGMKWLRWAWQQLSYQALWNAPENLLPQKEAIKEEPKATQTEVVATKEKSASEEKPKRSTGRKITEGKEKKKK